ncbi:PLP-dependent aminotransferase family protein [Metaclostridioides mangenotii]|uniref:MocR-like pyridoxine biosynthesis transcription factor PdxR n=1 Tax=Metaclostridioides mangenotii TaxID=1540 RepID=UPI0004812B94|nr:PLP-dependent aminotransferase family protein [Clostridioides mangenotii]
MEKFLIDMNQNKTTKYLHVYNCMKKMIQDEKLNVHEKLPPIRKFSKLLGVNNATIIKAYELLENEGYIYKIVGNGTFVSNLKGENTKPKETRDGIIHFDSGNPSNDMFPIDSFKYAVNMALEKDGNSIFDYEEGLGSEDLRKNLVEYLKSLKINTTVDNIQIISGAQQGIDIVCKGIISHSDVVFVEEPSYAGAIDVFKSRGAKIISIPMLDDGIDIGILKMKLEKFKPKFIYTMPNFQNPTGISYSAYKKNKLIELAKKHDFYILEDDFISDFKFNSEDNRPLRSYDDIGRVIYIKSFSKILMPGLRIGLVEVPSMLMTKILIAKHSSDISTPGLIQKSMYYFMKNFAWDTYLRSMENVYMNKYSIAEKLIKEKLSKKIKVRNSCGGINFFLELPLNYNSQTYADFLVKKGVYITPGTYFFDKIVEDRFFRVNIAKPSISEIEDGISIISDSIEEFFDKYKYK